MKRNARRRRGPRVERLEVRTVFAAVSGWVWFDENGNSEADPTEQGVQSAVVWIDSNRDGRLDAGEPQTRTDEYGGYAFSGLAAGDYEIRMQPTPGLFQTSPSQYFAYYRDNAVTPFVLAEIDVKTGSVTPITPEVGNSRSGLIKTIHGDYYGAGHEDDSLYRIDSVTGEQTLVGDTGKELVGGLAYDPIMDKIYTLASDTDVGAPPLILYEMDQQTGQLTRVGTGEGLPGIRGTSSMTFDLVNREVVLFDNNLDEIIAYDLNGNGRKLSRFQYSTAFYNLAFDGYRFLTFYSNSQSAQLYEVDVNNATVSPVHSLDQPLDVNAADILATNEPHRVHLDSASAEEISLNFLTNRMNITQGTLEIDETRFRLSSSAKRLDVATALDDETMPLRFCVGTLASNLTLEQSLVGPRPIEIIMSDLDDRLSVDAAPLVTIQMGAGRDTLATAGPVQLNLPELTSIVSGVDVVDLSASGAATLVSDAESIRTITDSKKLTVIASADDSVDLGLEPWEVAAPVAAGERRLHQLSVDDVLLELDDGLGWHNPLNAMDVNYDGSVSPIDALLIINMLNQAGSRFLKATDSKVAYAEYVDTSGDNFVSPIDALVVINEINRNS